MHRTAPPPREMSNLTAPSPSPSISAGAALTLLAAASLTVMANATISPALPEMRNQFAELPAITTLVGMLMTLPSLAVALTAGPIGVLADRWDKRRLLLVSLIIYGLGGASGWVARDFNELLVGRIVLGVGVAGVMTCVTALIGDFFSGLARDRFMGLQGAAQSIGGVMFLLSGGALAILGWRYPFLLYLLALLVLLGAAVLLPGSKEARQHGRTREPMPWGVVLGVGSLAVLSMIAFYIVPTKLPFLLRELGQPSPLVAGAAVAAMTATGAVSALSYSAFRKRLREASLLALIFGLMAVGYTLLAAARELNLVFAGAGLAGIGVGLLMPTLMSVTLARVSENQRGRASGALTAAVFLGQFLSPLVSGPLAMIVGLAAAFGWFAAGLAGLAAGALLIARTAASAR